MAPHCVCLCSLPSNPLIAYREGKETLTISCLIVGCSSVSLPEAGSLCTISTRISFLAETTPFRSGQRGRRRGRGVNERSRAEHPQGPV